METENKEKFLSAEQENQKEEDQGYASRNQYSGSGDFSPDELENTEKDADADDVQGFPDSDEEESEENNPSHTDY